MEKTLSIAGMMCEHCAARVKASLEALPQVDEAAVDHSAGEARLRLNTEIDDEHLKSAIEDLGYQLI